MKKTTKRRSPAKTANVEFSVNLDNYKDNSYFIKDGDGFSYYMTRINNPSNGSNTSEVVVTLTTGALKHCKLKKQPDSVIFCDPDLPFICCKLLNNGTYFLISVDFNNIPADFLPPPQIKK